MGFARSIHSVARGVLKKLIPRKLVAFIRDSINRFRSRRRAIRRDAIPPLTMADLVGDLRNAGIGAGDVVMVHSSLSRIGNVVGGAETVVRSFIDVIGGDGTLIMPCYNSAETAIADMKTGQFVDLRTSPSSTGKISEVFRTWPGVARSSHPFSSSCALGRLAAFITSGHDADPHVCHADSPVGRLMKSEGWVVGIGIPIAQGLGVAHHLEDTWEGFPIPVHAPPIEMTYIDATGARVTREIICFDPAASRTRIDRPEGAWICETLMGHLVRRGVVKKFKYGRAESWLASSVELHAEMKRLAGKGVTMYLTPEKQTDQNRDVAGW